MSRYSHDMMQAVAKGWRRVAVNHIRQAFDDEREAEAVYNQTHRPAIIASAVLRDFVKACAEEGLTAAETRETFEYILGRTDSGSIEKTHARAEFV